MTNIILQPVQTNDLEFNTDATVKGPASGDKEILNPAAKIIFNVATKQICSRLSA